MTDRRVQPVVVHWSDLPQFVIERKIPGVGSLSEAPPIAFPLCAARVEDHGAGTVIVPCDKIDSCQPLLTKLARLCRLRLGRSPMRNYLFLIRVYLRSSAFQTTHSESASKS